MAIDMAGITVFLVVFDKKGRFSKDRRELHQGDSSLQDLLIQVNKALQELQDKYPESDYDVQMGVGHDLASLLRSRPEMLEPRSKVTEEDVRNFWRKSKKLRK